MKKSVKRAIIASFFLLLIFPFSVSAGFQRENSDLTKSAARIINLNGKYRSGTQGMCIAEHYLVVTRWSNNSSATTYMVIDLKTKKEVGHYEFYTGHSNSMTYNPEKKEIVVVTDGRAYRFSFENGVMQKKDSISIGNHSVKVAYVASEKSYFISTGIRTFKTKDFRTLTEMFRASEIAINQGMASDGKNLYICWYGSTKNTIQVLTPTGRQVKSYVLDDSVCNEVEEVDFYNGDMYINVTGSGSKNGIYVVPGDGSSTVVKEENVKEESSQKSDSSKKEDDKKEDNKEPAKQEEKPAEEVHVHTFSDWKVTKEATCAEDGSKERVCTDKECGKVEKKVIKATGEHKEGEWEKVTEQTCVEKGVIQKFCTVCGKVLKEEVIAATGHKYGEWHQSKVPTVFESEEEIRRCTVCGLEEIRTGEPLQPFLILTSSVETAWYKDPVKLTAEVNEGDSIVSWKSSDSKVASVSKDGVVTPHRPGNVTIKVRTESGLVKECHVKVKVVQLD